MPTGWPSLAGAPSPLPMPIVLPLIAAALSILCGRYRSAQRIIGITTLTALVVLSIVILQHVDREGIVVVQAGDWPAPLGITLVADRLSAIMLATASIVLLAVLIYAIGQPGVERNHVGFQSTYLMLAAGVSAAFLTGDLFDLFVAIEMMLTASYVLMTLGGRLEQVRSGMTYVVISLTASVLFLLALAFMYAATGTMNLADLVGHIAELPAGLRSGARRAAARRLRNQGRPVPVLLLAPRQLPDGAGSGHGDLRRAAHQGRRSTPSSARRRCCSRATAAPPRCCSSSPA